MLNTSRFLSGSLAAIVILGMAWGAPTQAQQTSGWTCQIPAQADRIIVLFNNKLIRSSQTQDKATDGPVAATIPAGTYNITLESFNSHSTKADPFQPHEQYFLILSNSQTTSSISDLPDAQDSLVEQVDTGFVITSAVTAVTARSTKWPEPTPPPPKEINSIVPVCAAFDLVTPASSPTPPVAAVGGSALDDEADCCPGPDEPVATPTPTPTPVPKIKGATTAVATPSPTPSVAPLGRLPSAGLPTTNLVLSALLAAAAALASRLVYKDASSR